MLYSWIKILHIISASILFGTGIGSAIYIFYIFLKQDLNSIAKALTAVISTNWFFIATSTLILALTGLFMLPLKGYSLYSLWVYGSILGYIIAGACWLPIIWIQMRCRDIALACGNSKNQLPKEYKIYLIIWQILGSLTFITLIIIFYLMINKPVSIFN